MPNEFGNTNSDDEYKAVIAWRNAALADGWTLAATYEGIEPSTSYGTISKEGGWTGHVCARVATEMQSRVPWYGNKWKYSARVTLWGPDGLDVPAREVYDWAAIVAGLRTCAACGKKDVPTQRYSFAGRCCADCRPTMAAQHEQPGWCD